MINETTNAPPSPTPASLSASSLHYEIFGSGRPLLLVHGLGSSWLTWAPVLAGLAAEREVIAIDLPGHGATPPLDDELTMATMTDAVEAFMVERGLQTVDLVGTSMGARIVLELARRGLGGDAVALDPGGFWTPVERRIFGTSVGLSIRLVKAIQPWLPRLAATTAGRTALLSQFSAHPSKLDPALVLADLRSFALSPSIESALAALAHGPNQLGAASTPGRLTIGWGVHDRVTVRSQATTALAAFPEAGLHWFDDSGHFPHWDQPQETISLILEKTGATALDSL